MTLTKARHLLKEAGGTATALTQGNASVDSVYSGVVEALVKSRSQRRRHSGEGAPRGTGRLSGRPARKDVQKPGVPGQRRLRERGDSPRFLCLQQGAAVVGSEDRKIDACYAQQAAERDRQKREAVLHKIQQKLYDEARFIPIWELAFLCASGPRAAVSGMGLIPTFAYSGPYEDVRLKS